MKEFEVPTFINELKRERKGVLDPAQIPVRDDCYREMFDAHSGESVNKQFAYGFERFLQQKKILIQDKDIFAGFPFHYAYNTTLPSKMAYDFDPAATGVYKMDLNRELQDVIETTGDPSLEPEMRVFTEGVEAWLFKHIHTGHFMAGYEDLINQGFSGILQRIDAALQANLDPEKKDVLESFEIVTKAACAYVERYEKLAAEKEAAAQDDDVRFRMGRIKEACAHIKMGTPRTLFEAMQLYWFGHEIIICESYPSSISLGRFDYYLYPYYEKDLQAGIVTEQEAFEFTAAFWIKCSANVKAFQNLTLGGCDENGTCSVNDLTYIALAASKAMRFDQPALTFRWTDDMPQEAWEGVLDLIKEGMGFPALFYDPVCMSARKRAGIHDKDVYRYAMTGCVEFGIPGKEYTLTEIGRLNMPKVLELMMHAGLDPVSGKTFPLATKRNLGQIETFDDLFQWYLDEMENITRIALHDINRLDEMYGKKYPLPFLSVLMENCIESGTDVAAGGATYNNSSFNTCGIATLADSLAAIKKLVFDQKRLTLQELVEVLDANFEGYEQIRQLCLKDCAKYGNDIEEVDALAVEIVERFTSVVEEFETPRGGKYRVGLYTVEDHTNMGVHTNATADGRLKGEAFSNSLASVQGKDTEGPTALLNTVNKFDLSKATNGMVLDVKFTPAFLETDSHCAALRSIIETYFKRGGMEIQISVVSRDTLVEAQKHPEQYQDLVVRVSGFSAYFVLLQKGTQDEIIKRTESLIA